MSKINNQYIFVKCGSGWNNGLAENHLTWNNHCGKKNVKFDVKKDKDHKKKRKTDGGQGALHLSAQDETQCNVR